MSKIKQKIKNLFVKKTEFKSAFKDYRKEEIEERRLILKEYNKSHKKNEEYLEFGGFIVDEDSYGYLIELPKPIIEFPKGVIDILRDDLSPEGSFHIKFRIPKSYWKAHLKIHLRS